MTINCVFLSFICLTSISVLSVVSTEPASNLLNSFVVCESKSFLSTRNITFFIFGLVAKICAVLNDVKVLPAPVVCQIYAFYLLALLVLQELQLHKLDMVALPS